MQACGNVGSAPTIFSTFGAATVQVRKGLRDTMDPKGIMWDDALPREFMDMVNGRKKTQFKLDVPQRKVVFNARYAQAMAELSSGEVFLGVLNYDGDFGGQGAYQNVRSGDRPEDNVWIQWEFPHLQKNPHVEKVTTFAAKGGTKHVDYERGKKGHLKQVQNADLLDVPPVPAGFERSDQPDVCPMLEPSSDGEGEEECGE